MQPANARLELLPLVVDGDDDLDGGRPRERRRVEPRSLLGQCGHAEQTFVASSKTGLKGT